MTDEANQQDVGIYIYEFAGEDKKIQLLFSLDRDAQFNVEVSAREIEAAEGWDKNRVLHGKGARLNDAEIDGVLLPAEQHLDKSGRVTEAWSYRDGKCFGQLSAEELARLNRDKGVAPKIPSSLKHLPGAARAVFLTEPVLADADTSVAIAVPEKTNNRKKFKIAAGVIAVALTGIFMGSLYDRVYTGKVGTDSAPETQGSMVKTRPEVREDTVIIAAPLVSTPQGVAALPRQNKKSKIIVPPISVPPNLAAKSLQGVQIAAAKSSEIPVAAAPPVSSTEAAGKNAPESMPAPTAATAKETGTEQSGNYTYKVWGANFFKVYTYSSPTPEQRAAIEQNYEKITSARGKNKVDALNALGINPVRVEWVERNGNKMGATIAELDVGSMTVRRNDGSVTKLCSVENRINARTSISIDGLQQKSEGDICAPKTTLSQRVPAP